MSKHIPVSLFFILLVGLSSAIPKDLNRNYLQKSQILSTAQFDGNRIDADMENTGMFVSHRITGHSGLEWPKGSGKYSIFSSGPWFAGKVNGEIRTAAAEYAPEFTSGPWGSDGADSTDKLYKVNKTDLFDPESNPDFANWPIHQGAPWVDEDGDGIYTPMPDGPDHPDFLGDQVIYYVMHDGDEDRHVIFGTAPLGLEIRVTIWGYDRQDTFGDMMFVKYQIYNKGGNEIDSMYFGLWSDPDLGDAGDDWVGCDTTRNLGFCYNDGPDARYGDPAPAVAYDLLQVAVPSDGLSDEQYCFGELKSGYQGLSMTTFIKYDCGGPFCSPGNAEEAYNNFMGYYTDGSTIFNSATGAATTYMVSGDPNLNVDDSDMIWVDSDDSRSGDRYFLLGSGPFNFSSGDSAELVFAIIHSLGSSAFNSVTKLKEDSDRAQILFESHHVPPSIPPTPQITSTSSRGRIILEWDSAAQSYTSYDPFTETYYAFEGYNIYQLENPDGTGTVKKIATFDIINGVTKIEDVRFIEHYKSNALVTIQEGSDSGLQHSLIIEKDALKGEVSLIDDREYYFAVTSYGYGEITEPHMLESEQNIISVRPQSSVSINPVADLDSTFVVSHTSSTVLSEGMVTVRVINPSLITGHDYEITFDTLTSTGESNPTTIWNLTDITTSAVVLASQWIQSGIDTYTGIEVGSDGASTIDGLQIVVNGVPNGIHGVWQTSNGDGPIAGIDDDVNENIVWINFLTAPDYPTSQVTPTDIGVSWFFVTHAGGTANDWDSFYNRIFRNDNFTRAISNDFEMRFTSSGSKAWMAYTTESMVDVPFELWNLGPDPQDTSDDFQMITWLEDMNGNDIFDWSGDDLSSSASNDPTTDYIYWRNPTDTSPGTVGYAATIANGYAHTDYAGEEVMANTRLMNWNAYASHKDTILLADLSDASPANWNAADTAAFLAAGLFIDAASSKGVVDSIDVGASGIVLHQPEEGTTFRWITNKPNSFGDTYSFSTAGYEPKAIVFDPVNIKVWPNPYLGRHPEQTGNDDYRIHFINLPDQATIRIYTLTGQLIQELDHAGSQEAVWDVHTHLGDAVASGVYIAVVDTDQGQKVLKLAVVVPIQ